MKTLIISLIALFLTTLPVSAISNATKSDVVRQSVDSTNIQVRIMDAFVGSFADQNNSTMQSVIQELSSSYEKSNNSLFLYWKGYALYYNSIIYLKNSDKTNAKKELTKAIETLMSIKTKNSEDYALLSMLQSFSCQFVGFPEVVKVSKEATINIEKAVELDNNNLRAYYVLANNDYYTPENYGGGRNVEKYALKAISLSAQKIKNHYLPSWGKQESYELLTNYYIKQKKMEQAKEYIEKGLKEFPNSNTLRLNESKLPSSN